MEEQLEIIELTIRDAKNRMDKADQLERLRKNRDFIEIILKGYFEEEAIRLVHAKSNPSMNTKELQDSIDKSIFAIGSLSNYFRHINYEADLAAKAIKDHENTREEILAEGVA